MGKPLVVVIKLAEVEIIRAPHHGKEAGS